MCVNVSPTRRPTASPVIGRRDAALGLRRPVKPENAALNLSAVVAFLCAGTFVARSSLLAHMGSEWIGVYVSSATIASLLLAGAYVAFGGIGRINTWGALLIVATSVSLWHCERFDFVLPRWVGWVILMWTVGPVSSSETARRFRHHMLGAVNVTFLAVTILSAMWWLAGMPNLGRGSFTGVVWHSMLLGPIAAYVGIRALARVFTGGSLSWLAIYGASGAVALLSSSRAALLALALGSLISLTLKAKKSPLIAISVLFVTVAMTAAPDVSWRIAARFLPEEFTSGLATKSWENTRENHWQARWDEFMSSPFNGVGFTSAWEGTVGVDEESGAVETGSSYLAVLSMTGCIGAAAFAALVMAMGGRVLARRREFGERQLIEIASIAGFWAVHLGAEGYIFAVGSLLGVVFWLWFGNLNDLLLRPTMWRVRPAVNVQTANQSQRRPSVGVRSQQAVPAGIMR